MELNKLINNNFFTGCNYWASASGIYMWRHWDAVNVEDDFKKLSEYGCDVLRIFPLWPDFQPLNKVRGYGGVTEFTQYKNEEGYFPNTAGVDPVMVDRMITVCDLAQKYNIKLIIGLLTGWMSGRCFAPSALEHLNHHSSVESIMWQVRLVKHLVSELRYHEAIIAWDLGNECNCMGRAENHFEAWNWSNTIANAIKTMDNERLVLSGMHSLEFGDNEIWRIIDQGEVTDILTTHPYPLFTNYCNLSPLGTMRNNLHGVAESLLYSNIGGKPCFPEESGSLGAGVASDRRAAMLMTGSLSAAWAHNLPGFLWWCAFKQNHLDYSPYNEIAVERDLGLFSQSRSATLQATALKNFHEKIKSLPKLPNRKVDIITLLTVEQDSWGTAFGSFILSKLSGLDIEFQDANSNLKDSNCYWLPSIVGIRGIPRRNYLKLLDKVKSGATLLVSGNGILEPFADIFGVEVEYRYKENFKTKVTLSTGEELPELELTTKERLNVKKAVVLATNEAGDAVLTHIKYGAGDCFYLGIPLETIVGTKSGLCETENYHKIYELIFRKELGERILVQNIPSVSITEHHIDANNAYAVIINHSDNEQTVDLLTQNNWQISEWLVNNNKIAAGEFSLLKLVK